MKLSGRHGDFYIVLEDGEQAQEWDAVFILPKEPGSVYYAPYNYKWENIQNLNHQPCAEEGGLCKCGGQVYYGNWMSIKVSVNNRGYKVRDSYGDVECRYSNFGLNKKYDGM